MKVNTKLSRAIAAILSAHAAQAHRDLEARKTSGKLLLIP